MPTNITEVIGTGTAEGQRPGILVLLNMHLVVGTVVVIFDPKTDGSHELITFNELYITNGMDFLAPADDLIGSVVVYEFEQVG
jgi:hypothetical protein